ncbi:MAG: hypothetical protein RIS03_879 [Pseudomonadota bacterium]
MRNEYAQEHHLAGDIIHQRHLIEYIERNRCYDWATQEWFFQNGPQKVYLSISYTPFVARLFNQTLTSTCGNPLEPIECYMDEEGHIIFQCESLIQVAKAGDFLKEKHRFWAKLHDADLEEFSRIAEINTSCGLLGEVQLKNKKIAIEQTRMTDIKAQPGLLPSSRNS